jgi:selenocysteine lyase/cysteine desulfurase
LSEKPHLGVFSSRLPGEKSSIVSIAFKDPAEVSAKFRLCREKGIVVNRRAGRLRVSTHCYNSVEEIDRVVELL